MNKMGTMNSDQQLRQLFKTCDKKGKGYIVAEELRELCSGLGITAEDSDVIFGDLDQDRDGQISYTEFSKGFTEFLNPETEVQAKRRFSTWGTAEEEGEMGGLGEQEIKRRESVYQAWNNLTNNLADLAKTSPESGAQIKELLQDLERAAAPPDVATRISSVISTLLKEIQQLQSHHKSLEVMYKKEREHHFSALKSLENELEDQVAKVEERARLEAKQESEEEKRLLQDQMDQEMATLQTHLKIFQKVESWLNKDDGDEDKVTEVRRKLEEAYQANRSLNMNLNETTTNLGLLRSDLAQMRLQYEEKCRELHSEREQVLEYMHQYDHMKRQLELLHEANKRLQDTNDSLRDAMEFEWRRSPLGSRCSSNRSSFRQNKERKRSKSRSRSPHPPILPIENEGGLKFGIRRLMDDLDSGLSTLPDTAEESCNTQDSLKYSETEGPLSLEDELIDLESSSPSPAKSRDEGRITPLLNGHSSLIPPVVGGMGPPPPKPLRVGRSMSPHSADSAKSFEPVGVPERTYKVVFAGDAAVGKSTFIVRLCRGCFVNNLASTLGVDYKVKTLMVDEKNIAMQLWDTAGQERFRSITKTYFRRADGVLLLYDVTSERSFLNVRQWIQSIDEACLIRVPLVLCGNKADLRDAATAQGQCTVSPEDGERLARDYGAAFIETSCKNGAGVMDALVILARQMVTHEDVEVQTSALKISANDPKRSCCGTKKSD